MKSGVKLFSLLLLISLVLCSLSSVFAYDSGNIFDGSDECDFNEINEENLKMDVGAEEPLDYKSSVDSNITLSESDSGIALSEATFDSGADSDIPLSEGEVKSFADLRLDILKEGNISLKNDYAFTSTDNPLALIAITNDNIVIDGEGHTIDASNRMSVFYITGCNVTLRNITFINGNASTNQGGVVNFLNEGSIVDCVFKHNFGRKGGAVYFSGKGSIINCSFEFNNAAQGGAVFISSQGSVINSTFKDNVADNGGAIYAESDSVNITYSNFTDNIADGDGGAIILYSGSLSHSIFINNIAKGYGGAISLSNGSVSRSNFTQNKATRKGGAIYSSIFLRVTDSNFNSNFAGEGGALYFVDMGIVNRSSFNANYAISEIGNGGSINFESDGKSYNNNFTGNYAEGLGGAIYCRYVLTSKNDEFDNNIARDNTGDISSERTYASPVFYLDGSANSSGDGSRNSPWKTLREALDNCHNGDFLLVYPGNYLGEGNVGLNISKSLSIIKYSYAPDEFVNFDGDYISQIFNIEKARVYFEDIVFCNGYANKGGALSISHDSIVLINSSSFNNNFAKLNGGAIYNEGFLEIKFSSFNGNTQLLSNMDNPLFNLTNLGGGAITSTFPSSILNIEASSFTENHAAESGGAIQDGYMTYIDNCLFYGNTANDGGAIRSYVTSNLMFSDRTTRFISNRAQRFGGAIDLVVLSSPLCNLYFEDNVAFTGGAIYGLYQDNVYNPQGQVRLDLRNCTFIENKALEDGWGGAIGYCIGDNKAIVSIDGCDFVNNSACYGGAIYSAGTLEFVGHRSNFLENRANYFRYAVDENTTMIIVAYGGAIMHFGSFDFEIPVVFERNSAPKYGSGGAIAASGLSSGSSMISYAYFIENSCGEDRGGAIYTNHDLVIFNCEFLDNYAYDPIGPSGRAVGGTIFCNNKDAEIELVYNNFFYTFSSGMTTSTDGVKPVLAKEIYTYGPYSFLAGNYAYNPIDSKFVLAVYSEINLTVLDSYPHFTPNKIFDNSNLSGANESNGFTSSDITNDSKETSLDLNLKISVSSITEGQKAIIKITSIPKFSGVVNLKVGLKTYAVKVLNGKGSIAISGLKTGTYRVVASFDATKSFKASIVSIKFKVKPHIVKLSLSKVKVIKSTKKSAKKSSKNSITKMIISAALKIDGKAVKGKKLKFIFNGKRYYVKTNKKGIAKLIIKRNVIKKFKIGKKIKYQVIYGGKTVKRTVKF